MTDIACEECCH